MKRILLALATLVLASQALAANWEAGKHYEVLAQPQRTSVAPGKVEVLEVFSYGCPACNHFVPTMSKLKASLPANAQLVYLPASWHPEENWVVFQRAFITAQQLGVANKAHEEFFNAVWKTYELGVVDPRSNTLKNPLPSIEDTAKFYQRVAGVKPADFVAASKSFGVDMKIRAADAQVHAMKVLETPSIVVNGKYLLNNHELKTSEEFVELVKFLIAKEARGAAAR